MRVCVSSPVGTPLARVRFEVVRMLTVVCPSGMLFGDAGRDH